jgi:CRISPR-associated protein Cas2
MMVLVTYDIDYNETSSAKRLRKIAKTCENYGQRVQKSVFEMDIDPAQFAKVKDTLLKIMDNEKDSIRFYLLGSNWKRRIEHYGHKPMYEQDSAIIL